MKRAMIAILLALVSLSGVGVAYAITDGGTDINSYQAP